MKKFKRIIASFVTVLTLLAIAPVTAHAEWKSDSKGWWNTEGSSYSTGWKQIDGNWYYFSSDGYMAHDTTIDGYYLSSGGAWTTNIPNTTTSYTGGNNSGSTASTAGDTQSQTAYLSATGSKYHSKPDCGNMNASKATKTTVAEAEKEGFGRCSKCW
ncbi:hypothetical protein psyc5s11_29760 [Clostridium gelidum]|uniref:Cell wall-binding protein n=1 Tax=Clostridium gelidum TaxID=704125 RepID=A0ABN6IXR0_9CLOT|nr:cell wall-binding protein [Clostridium gelidum]BCZ46909.1 hypothetical protein psyc5s11_29760 [Clostridium gelidum]